MADEGGPGRDERAEGSDLRELRARIDVLDRRVVELLNQRARLALEIGRRKASLRQPVRDTEREREVLLRVTMANDGPIPQADLLALYRRLIASTRRLEADARRRGRIRDHGEPSPSPDR